MVPTEGWPAQRLDALARDLQAYARELGDLAVKVATGQRDVEGLNRSLERAGRDFAKSLQAFDDACDKKVGRLEKAVEESAKRDDERLRKIEKKMDDEAAARRWPPGMRWMVGIGLSSPFVLTLLQVLLRTT